MSVSLSKEDQKIYEPFLHYKYQYKYKENVFILCRVTEQIRHLKTFYEVT